MKLIHLTDPHLVAPGERLWGVEPLARFDLALKDIAAFHPDADCVVITGDLTERGDPAAYAALKERLADFSLPTVLMLGNHDDRDAYFSAFADAPRDKHGFAQGVRETEAGTLIFLDTLKPGAGAGAFCEKRRDWLAGALDEAGDAPVFIFMHHPPFDIAMPRLDRIKLEEADAFAALLQDRAIGHIFFGHVHRPVFTMWNGIPCSALPGLGHQVPLTPESVATSYSIEPPLYAVVRLADGRALVHLDAFFHRRPAS